MSILVIGLDPLLERTILFERLTINEVNRAKEVRLDASGTGLNCARVLLQFGASLRLLSSSCEEAARRFAELVRSEGMPVEYTPAGTAPGECTTVVSLSQHRTARFTTYTGTPSQEAKSQILSRYPDLLPGSRCVIITGSERTGFGEDFLDSIIKAARDRGIRTILSIHDAGTYRRRATTGKTRPDFIVVSGDSSNRIPETADIPGELEQLMIELLSEGSVPVVYREGGATLSLSGTGEDSLLEIEPVAVTPINRSGCGDAFLAGFAMEISEGGTTADAIERGHAAAAMNAAQLKPGTIRPE